MTVIMGEGERATPRFVRGGTALAARAVRLGLLAATAFLASCKTPNLLCFKSSGLGEISVSSTALTNDGRPIAVDVVYVADKDAWATISKLKARDYFAMRDLLARDFPKGYLRWSRELQAGQYVKVTGIAAPCNLVGTAIFVNYASDGDHRQVLGKGRSGTLVLGAHDFFWSPKRSPMKPGV